MYSLVAKQTKKIKLHATTVDQDKSSVILLEWLTRSSVRVRMADMDLITSDLRCPSQSKPRVPNVMLKPARSLKHQFCSLMVMAAME